jgi:hypothetical protein
MGREVLADFADIRDVLVADRHGLLCAVVPGVDLAVATRHLEAERARQSDSVQVIADTLEHTPLRQRFIDGLMDRVARLDVGDRNLSARR